MTLQTVDMLIRIITSVIAYAIAVTIAGSFKAWVANAFGDDTAESLGLISLNPIVHFDFFGLLLVFCVRFGWGRYVPVNPQRIQGPFRFLKIGFAYFAGVIAHLFMGVVTFSFLMYAFGMRIFPLIMQMLNKGRYAFTYNLPFAKFFPNDSSFLVSLGIIGISLLVLNIVLAYLDFIIVVADFISLKILDIFSLDVRRKFVVSVAVFLAMIFIFGHWIYSLMVSLVFSTGYILSHLLGVI
ncbi:hypothetical protein KAH94_00260 [bacterium]|nr:hypothetical protein [bacterium]